MLGEEPLQTKVLAYWPDGSVKWTGHSGLVAETTQLLFQRKQRVQKKQAIAREAYNGIYFDNGTIKGFFPKHGEGKNVLDWVAVNGQKKLQDLHAILQYQNKKVQSKVTDLMLEENGSEKAVIKVTGVIEINQEVVQEFIYPKLSPRFPLGLFLSHFNAMFDLLLFPLCRLNCIVLLLYLLDQRLIGSL